MNAEQADADAGVWCVKSDECSCSRERHVLLPALSQPHKGNLIFAPFAIPVCLQRCLFHHASSPAKAWMTLMQLAAWLDAAQEMDTHTLPQSLNCDNAVVRKLLVSPLLDQQPLLTGPTPPSGLEQAAQQTSHWVQSLRCTANRLNVWVWERERQ